MSLVRKKVRHTSQPHPFK
uniref:Uncharacterized protein n=1 Tax=Anguilla anguilla TaxID=7936 RepID=A0A0E9VRI6_ANGAN